MTYEKYEQAQELQKQIDYYQSVIDTIKNATYYKEKNFTIDRRLAAYYDGYANNSVVLNEEISNLLCKVLYEKQSEVQEEFDKL